MASTILDIEYLTEKNDLKKIYFADNSEYSITITNPTLEITAPGFKKVALNFTANSTNIYTAKNLNIECDEETALPDGVYTIKYTISPSTKHFVEKSFIRVNNIKCNWANKFLAIDLDCNCGQSDKKNLKNQLRDVKELIESAIASSNQCDFNLAYEKYNLANRILNRIEICNC